MHVLIIFILIVALVLCRIQSQSPRLEEGFDGPMGKTGSTGPTGATGPTEELAEPTEPTMSNSDPMPYQTPLYTGVW